MALKEIFLLRKRENRLFLILITWLLIGIVSLELFSLVDFPIIGIIIFIPFLGFTLFLYFVSLFKKNIKEYSTKAIVGLFIVSLASMPVFIIMLVILFVFSILSYLILTSSFILYACYKSGYSRDRDIYINKKHVGFWRGLEFFGGIIISILLLIGFIRLTFEIGSFVPLSGFIFEPDLAIIAAYVAVIIVICLLSLIAFLYALKSKVNAWMGVYFIFISVYAFYLVFKMLRIETGSSSVAMTLLSIVMDIGIILYSVSGLLGTQTEVLHKKFKLKQESVFLWLLFSKAAYEFAINFPYIELFGEPEQGILLYVVKIGTNLSTYMNLIVYALFLILIILYGIFGMAKYGKRTTEWGNIRGGEVVDTLKLDDQEERKPIESDVFMDEEILAATARLTKKKKRSKKKKKKRRKRMLEN